MVGEVVNYILGVDVKKVPPFNKEFDEHPPVSYMPAGVIDKTTAVNPENIGGAAAYNKWVKKMKSIALGMGMELQNFMDNKEKRIKKTDYKRYSCYT